MLRERKARLEQEAKEKRRRQNRIVYGTLGIFLAVILIAVAVVVIVTNRPQKMELIYEDTTFSESASETDYVRLEVTFTDAAGDFKKGNIYIELRPDVAPETVANFKSLVESGFYNGLTFHRIMPGFMIQGGDPKGDGTGGSDQTIKGEFEANGFENNLSHTRGVISMARSSNSYDSASSQFFIVHQDSAESLDGLYAAFGEVVSGMEVVDAITEVDLVTVDSQTKMPVHPVTIESATFVTR